MIGDQEARMPFPKQDRHDFNLRKISMAHPNQPGVYGIFSRSGCIYIGKSEDIQMSLLQHIRRESEQSRCILHYDPRYWLAVIVDKRQLLIWERILHREFEPVCLPQAIPVANKRLR